MMSDSDFARWLDGLKPKIEAAVAFADSYPEAYRSTVFEIATAGLTGSVSENPAMGGAAGKPLPAFRPPSGLGEPMRKLAAAVELDPDLVRRAISITEEGEVKILGRIHGSSTRDAQNKYSAVYAFVKEKAFGDLNVGVEELRTVCKEHGCYDVNNFSGNFTKDTRFNEMRGVTPKRYIPTKSALEEAVQLIREMAES